MAEQTATDINEVTFPKGCIRELETDLRALVSFVTRQVFVLIIDKQTDREAQRYLEDVLNSWDRVRLSHTSLLARVTELEGKLAAANGVLRSAYQIASRYGDKTNWEAFIKILKNELDNQHKILYPKEPTA